MIGAGPAPRRRSRREGSTARRRHPADQGPSRPGTGRRGGADPHQRVGRVPLRPAHRTRRLVRGDRPGRHRARGHRGRRAVGPGRGAVRISRRPGDPRSRRRRRRILVRRVPLLPERAATPVQREQADHRHVRGVLHGVGPLAGEDPRQPRRQRGAARVRRPHRVRRGEEAARPPRPPRSTGRDHRRRRRARALRGPDRERVRLPGRGRGHRGGAARLREVARRRPRGRRRRGRRRGPRGARRRRRQPGLLGADVGLPSRLRPAGATRVVGRSSACRPPARATSSSTRSSCS